MGGLNQSINYSIHQPINVSSTTLNHIQKGVTSRGVFVQPREKKWISDNEIRAAVVEDAELITCKKKKKKSKHVQSSL